MGGLRRPTRKERGCRCVGRRAGSRGGDSSRRANAKDVMCEWRDESSNDRDGQRGKGRPERV